jgi:RNA polymerase sigma-70 factor (ECF subfamily)
MAAGSIGASETASAVEAALSFAATERSPARVAGPPALDKEEAEWVSRARGGDTVAIGCLLARYRQRAVRLAAHVLRRPDEAEDVAQEAFVLAFRNLGSFRQQGRFYTWLYAIVVRVCLERKRSARWRSETQEEWGRDTAGPEQDTVERLLVESLLDRLSPPMRAALVLRELEGLEYEEIAGLLKIPVGTVRSRLNAARSQFRTLWQAAQEEIHDV